MLSIHRPSVASRRQAWAPSLDASVCPFDVVSAISASPSTWGSPGRLSVACQPSYVTAQNGSFPDARYGGMMAPDGAHKGNCCPDQVTVANGPLPHSTVVSSPKAT